jgi:competence protein ComEC
MNKMLAFIEHFPGASLDKIWLSTSEYLLLYVIVISLFLFWYLKRIRWLQFGLFCCLLLFISFSIKTILQSTTSSIAWLNLKKHPGIVFKNGQSAIVLTDLKESDKNYKYSIQPYLDSCRINDVKIYDLNCSVNTPWLKKKFGFIKFTNTSVFIYDGNLGTDALSPGLKIDFIYVTGNPELDTNTLEANFDFRALIIDGSNSDKRIANWEKQLYAKSINYKILKRNKSFISISN